MENVENRLPKKFTQQDFMLMAIEPKVEIVEIGVTATPRHFPLPRKAGAILSVAFFLCIAKVISENQDPNIRVLGAAVVLPPAPDTIVVEKHIYHLPDGRKVTAVDPAPTVKQVAKKNPPKSDYAPVDASDIKDADTRAYVQKYHALAKEEMRKYGVPASISLAQGLIESRAGNSKLAKQNNNHFGIKCFSTKCSKGHCTNHFDDTHKDFFRKYETAWESWRAHSIMISSGRYASLKKNGKDYKKWAHGLKRLGYATDRTYAEKLIKIIEQNQLNRYDR